MLKQRLGDPLLSPPCGSTMVQHIDVGTPQSRIPHDHGHAHQLIGHIGGPWAFIGLSEIGGVQTPHPVVPHGPHNTNGPFLRNCRGGTSIVLIGGEGLVSFYKGNAHKDRDGWALSLSSMW